ncbi:MAG: ABC transporter permease [Bryobacteraceae bacterium]|jgi:predicted permease
MKLRAWLSRLAGMLPGARRERERELAAEIDSHLQMHIDDNLRCGMTPEQARREAILQLGGVEATKEAYRDRSTIPFLEHLVQDFRFAIRQLRKSPGFTCTAVLVLALGMSASVAIFAFVDAALIQPLPYRDQSRLVAVSETAPDYPRALLSYADFADWKRLNHVFKSIDAYALNGGFTLSTRSGAEQAAGTRVSAGFFRTLGVSPLLGRDFYPGEDSPAAPQTVLISYAAWQRRFGGTDDVLGKTVTLNGSPHVIIGVLPRDFHFAPYGGAEFWSTLRSSDSCEQSRGCRNVFTVARLSDGISIQAASAGMQVAARQLQREYPESNRDLAANVESLRDIVVGDVRPILLVMLSSACLLLLIACVNLTTLLLARSDSRRREIALRGALGASSSRLFHQFATEGLVLAVAAGSLSLVFAEWGMRLLVSIVPEDKLESMPWLRGLGLDYRLVAFACGISLVAGAIFAVIPFLRVSAPDLADGLRAGTRGSSGTMWQRVGAKLVVVQVALAMVLMVSSGLLGRSLYLLLHVDTGMQPDHLASAQVDWLPDRYSTDEQRVRLERRTLKEIAALPGVRSVAVSLTHPVGSDWGTTGFHIVGRTDQGEQHEVISRQVSPAYFKTLEARLIRGRYFRESEDASKPPVIIVNRTLASRYFAGEDPIGKQICYAWSPRIPRQIVGVVEDIKEGSLENANWPAVYAPFDQNPAGMLTVLVRTSMAEEAVLPQVAATIHHIDRDLSVHDESTMTDRINGAPATLLHRSSAWVMGTFAGIAFVLGIVGLYGVVAYSVSQRTREIGVRIALGAEPRSVYRLILTEAARVVGVGTVLGAAGALGAARLIRGLLFGVSPWDGPTLAMAITVLGLAAGVASFIPARRAASIDPVEALRAE